MYLLAEDACHGLGNIILIVKFLLTIVQWVVPIILIVLGTIDLVKAVVAGKDDDIKKQLYDFFIKWMKCPEYFKIKAFRFYCIRCFAKNFNIL